MDINSILTQACQNISNQHRQLESQFWILSKEETHEASEEIELAKQLMIVQRHNDLLGQLLALRTQDPTLTYAFPLKYALQLLNNDPVVVQYFSGFTVEDISEEYSKFTYDCITDDMVKGYLVAKYEEQQSQTSSQWEDASLNNSQDVLELEDKDMNDIENMMQEHQDKVDEEPLIPEKAPYDQPKLTMKLHDDAICCIIQHPFDKEVFVTGSCDDSFKVTKLTNQKLVLERKQLGETVCLADYNHDGKYLAIGVANGVVMVLSSETSKNMEGGSSEVTVLKWHPKGNALLAGFEDCQLWMWNAVSGDVLAVFGGHEAQVTCGGFSHDGKMVLSGSADSTFRVWKPNTSEQQAKFSGHNYHKEEIVCYAQHHELPVVATGGSDCCIAMANLDNGKVIGISAALQASIVELIFLNTNQPLLLAGDQQGTIYIFNWNLMRVQDKVSLAQTSITRLIHNGSCYASTLDGKIITFDHRQLQTLKTLQAPSGILDFIVDGGNILIGCEDGCAYVY